MRIRVVAGVLRDREGRVLLTERINDKSFNGLWEFPGGKSVADEAPEAALGRELAEELGIFAVDFEPLVSVDYDYPNRPVHIDFFLVRKWRSQVRAMDGQELRWILPAEIRELELMPANAPVVEALQALAILPAWRTVAGGDSER